MANLVHSQCGDKRCTVGIMVLGCGTRCATRMHGTRASAAGCPDALVAERAAAGWAEANVAFMRSGGYSLSARVRAVAQRTLLLWGRHDEIVEPKLAQRYLQDIPDCRCGGRASAAMRP